MLPSLARSADIDEEAVGRLKGGHSYRVSIYRAPSLRSLRFDPGPRIGRWSRRLPAPRNRSGIT